MKKEKELGEQESFFIKEKEFYLLLAGKGIKKWFGLASDQKGISADIPDKKTLYQTLANLYQKDYVDWGKDTVDMKGPIANLLDILTKAKGCILFEKENREEIQSYYFSADKIVLIEKSRREPEMLELTGYQMEQFWNHFCKEEFFPQYEELSSEEVSLDFSEEEMEKKAEFTLMDIHTGIQIEKMEIKEAGIATFLFWERGDERKRMSYNREWFFKQIRRWLLMERDKENKHDFS